MTPNRTCIGLLICAVACAQSALESTTAILHVNVIDVLKGTVQRNMTVVMSGNRIVEVGDSDLVSAPRGARTIEAKGQYLIPGLWDMHVHLGNATEAALPILLANGITGGALRP
jgi:imidazolonepropionase-like amidohydrolase